MDTLEDMMTKNRHLGDENARAELDAVIGSLSPFWRVLSEEDRDFINAARFAMEEQMRW